MEGSPGLRCEEPAQSRAQRLVLMFPSPALSPETHCLTPKPDNSDWPGELVTLNYYRVSVKRWISEYENTQEVTQNMKVSKRSQRFLRSLKDVDWEALVRKQPALCSDIGKGGARVSGRALEQSLIDWNGSVDVSDREHRG